MYVCVFYLDVETLNHLPTGVLEWEYLEKHLNGQKSEWLSGREFLISLTRLQSLVFSVVCKPFITPVQTRNNHLAQTDLVSVDG